MFKQTILVQMSSLGDSNYPPDVRKIGHRGRHFANFIHVPHVLCVNFSDIWFCNPLQSLSV